MFIIIIIIPTYAQIIKSIYRYLRQYATNFCLTQLYFARGDMFRLLIQPSSCQLTIEQGLFMCAQYGIPHCLHIKYMRNKYICKTYDYMWLKMMPEFWYTTFWYTTV